MFASVVIHIVFTHGSGPSAALAAVIKDRSSSTWPHMGEATSTHVEAGPVIWVGVKTVRFAIAEAGSWGMGGGGGGGCLKDGGSTRFWGGARWQWGEL